MGVYIYTHTYIIHTYTPLFKPYSLLAPSKAVGTAAAEEVREAGGEPPEVAAAAAKAVFQFAKESLGF